MQDHTFEIESADEIREVERKIISSFNWSFGVGAVFFFSAGVYSMFFSDLFPENPYVSGAMTAVVSLVFGVGGSFGTHVLIQKLWPSGDLDRLIAAGIDSALDKNLPSLDISRGETIFSEDGEKLVEVSRENGLILLCRYLSKRAQLNVCVLPISDLRSIEYEFEPEEVKESYSSSGLYTAGGLMVGGIAGALVGGVVGDLVNAGRLIKLKLRFTAIFNLIDGRKKSFHVIRRKIEFSPADDTVLREELDDLGQEVNSFTEYFTKWIPGKLIGVANPGAKP